jgi:hypothetical protein
MDKCKKRRKMIPSTKDNAQKVKTGKRGGGCTAGFPFLLFSLFFFFFFLAFTRNNLIYNLA